MEEKKDQLQAVCVAAGALAVMAASLDHAAMVYSIVKQWRSWVFVVLNILLLAIVFTSKHGTFCNSKAESDVDNLDNNYIEEFEVNSKTERKKRVRKLEEQQQWQNETTELDEHRCKVMKSSEKKVEEKIEKIIECDDSEKSPLSKEELNERVEAFIATFRRQHLVSDVKGKRSSSVYNSPAKNGGRDILSKKNGGSDILSKSISV